jgi:hypothetical protein
VTLPSLVAGMHPTISLGFGVEQAHGDFPAVLVVSFLLFHVRIPLGKSREKQDIAK